MTIPVSSNEGAMECVKVMITPDQQKRIITELTDEADHNLKQGNLYYVVSYRWMARWYRYTGQEVGDYLLVNHSTDHQSSMLPTEVERPGPVDNSDIVVIIVDSDGDENEIELRRNLKDVSDYVIVPQRVWERLIEWYGGGPAIPRQLVSLGDVNKQFYVEVYPVCLNLLDSRDNSQSIIRLSRKTSLHELYQKVCKLRQVEPAKARIWDYYMRSKHGIIEDSDKTIEKTQLHLDQDILLEVLVDGFYPSTGSLDSTGNDLALVLVEPPRSPVTIGGGPSPSSDQASTYFSSLSQGSILGSGSTKTENGYDFFNSVAKPEKKGLAGLQNLGNTCFMNSALQCLVHTPPIVEYFLQDYSDEINSENPLGLGGELAAAFGELLRKLWTIGQIGIIPRAFKAKLAQFAPQFSGYNQHDSQELLAFLLDGLHEDLNRVKQKPYFEVKDSGGRPDDEVAEECWTYHMARNDSIIVDVCQGQYKSTLVCPECKKISITFDPFMYLSLPLPSKVTRKITVTVFSGDGSFLPISHTVVVLKNGVCQDLTQALATQCSLKTDERFLLAEVFLNKIYRYLEKPLEPLSTIKDEEYVVAYIIPKWPGDLIRLQIYHRCPAKYCWHSKGWTDFLTPLVTYVDKRQSKADIELAVKRVMLPMKKENVLCSIEHVTDNGNENSSIEHVNDNDNENSGCEVIMVDSGPESESDSVEMEDISTSGVLSLKPCVIGDRFCRPVFDDSEIEPHPLSKVTLDWTSKVFEAYDPNYLKNLPEVYKTEQGSVSLFSCLDAFLKEEPLGPDDMWHCPSCKEHRQAKKKLDLWRLPEILVFHLKRFSYGRYFNNKLETFVDFDIHNLDLNKYVKHKDPSGRSYVYELYAISNHYGGLGGGHYSAYAKVIEENGWYHFDDSHVSTVDEADIKTSAAYVLFYQRVQASA